MEKRPVNVIAREIMNDWSDIGRGISPYADPYLRAMLSLNSAADSFGADTGASVIAYGLNNMQGYRGEVAKGLKAELKSHIS